VAAVPAIRIRACNTAPVRASGRFVLYWMISSRRLHYNFALDRALEHSRELRKPLLILEALRCGHPWASDRLHCFVLHGMVHNAALCGARGLSYFPYVEPTPGAGSGLLAALAGGACLVVTDDFPCFFLSRMVAAAAKKLSVRFEAVDSNGLLPLRAAPQAFPTAYAFRRFLQKALPAHLSQVPSRDPLSNYNFGFADLPKTVTSQWPAASAALLAAAPAELAKFPIDHSVPPSQIRGGHHHACARLKKFLKTGFRAYADARNQLDRDGSSGLSPYLHFGHLSVHEIFAQLVRLEKWKPEKLALRANGSREGWWNMSPSAEAFLDELITWRELGYNFTAHRADYGEFASLPAWARQTLKKHARDERAYLYSLEQLEFARTHDPLWNAAQTQLLREGRIHNYLRMLWGKKILEWSRTPQDAAEILIHLNNKYALDGRDPNSYSGIFWCFGRYDRPWGPERPIFGTVRYMSSQNAARKLRVRSYLSTWNPVGQTTGALLQS
jgi:deoxyribodipyrimidine photo-lyase